MTSTYATLSVTLSGTGVSRTVAVPHHISLTRLHNIIQAAMGWENAHLHEFRTGREKRRGMMDLLGQPDRRNDKNESTLGQIAPTVGSTLEYIYDFGDSWHHRIEVTELAEGEGQQAILLDARGGCPPEDFGGTYLFNDFLHHLEADADKLPPEVDERLEHHFGDTPAAQVLEHLRTPDLAQLRTAVTAVDVGITVAPFVRKPRKKQPQKKRRR